MPWQVKLLDGEMKIKTIPVSIRAHSEGRIEVICTKRQIDEWRDQLDLADRFLPAEEFATHHPAYQILDQLRCLVDIQHSGQHGESSDMFSSDTRSHSYGTITIQQQYCTCRIHDLHPIKECVCCC